jgi:hypothetical protein
MTQEEFDEVCENYGQVPRSETEQLMRLRIFAVWKELMRTDMITRFGCTSEDFDAFLGRKTWNEIQVAIAAWFDICSPNLRNLKKNAEMVGVKLGTVN